MIRDEVRRTSLQEHRRAADASLRLLFDATTDAIVIHREGQIVYANAACEREFGYPAAELIGRSPLDFVTREFRWRVAERILQTYGSHEVAREIVERFIRADGTVVDALVLAVPFVFDGQPATLVHIRHTTAGERGAEIERA